MKNRKIFLSVLLSIALVFSLLLPGWAMGASTTVPRPDDHSIIHSTMDGSRLASAMALNTPQGQVTPMVAAGGVHTVGLKSDGTVIAVGDNSAGQCDVGGWRDVVQVAAGYEHTVGLKADGTVVAVGCNDRWVWWGQCDVGGWTDIIQVAAGYGHTVGLKADGTVVSVGAKGYEDIDVGQWDVGGWRDIRQVSAGYYHTVGLKSDGTVVAVGNNYYGPCNVGGWTDITKVAAGGDHTVGLKSDGTVVAVGTNEYGPCNVGGWRDIVQVVTGSRHTVGLKSDGTVVAVGQNSWGECDVGGWTDIVQVAAGGGHTVGLKSNGTVVTVGVVAEPIKWNLGVITEYTLNISSTAGGAVITPGEESFNYDAGAMVHLVAEPDAGYRFVNWTGDVGAIFNVNATTTIVSMRGDYSITANFAPINWPLIGGIIAAVVIAGLGIFFFRRKRAARTMGDCA